MEAALSTVRAIHIGALVALFGGLLFALWAAGVRASGSSGDAARGHVQLVRSSSAWLVLALASGFAWLGLEAVSMSGLPLGQALGPETLGTVLGETAFGQVWIARGGLCIAVAALLVAIARQGAGPGRGWVELCTMSAAALLCSLAWVGHANSERGTAHLVHLAADVLHLLAAGAWLGALVPLLSRLGRDGAAADAAALEEVVQVVRRFSSLGLLSVGLLIVTGLVNAWFTVATIPALLTTHYGHLLLLKLALFVAMLGLAATNRLRLTPALAEDSSAVPARALAIARLRRNAIGEVALGMVILGIVGSLGTTMPASHSARLTPAMHIR